MENNLDFKEILEAAALRREKIASRNTAYRLVNGIADGLSGVTLDRFGTHFQLQFFGAENLRFKKVLVNAVQEFFNPEFFVIKYRLDPSGKILENPRIEIETGTAENSSTFVQEGPCIFQVDLLDTVNPGLFLDMRAIREEIAQRSENKSLLNLFSYTCSFAVHARVHGAEHVTNVDISAKILEKGQGNYALNSIEAKPGEFFRGNSEEYLRWCVKKGKRFDGIILDPPSFSRDKNKVFRVKDDLQKLVHLCGAILAPDGFLMVSSNYSGFTPETLGKTSLQSVRETHPQAKLIWCKSQGEDFPGSGNSRESCLSAALITVS
ncbi:MAG: class I SAM-dependent methyltransferase [Fibrobacter sp.]|jgi:23S rRNA (cytosine1962-C5)-methyltransferase|nr:class I SAM-dependent methyltransferase [Fibrobacter sp.]